MCIRDSYGTNWVMSGLAVLVMQGAVIYDLPKGFTQIGVGYTGPVPNLIIIAAVVVILIYAIAFTDGRTLGAALDRNGLRPARYYVTRDGRFMLASEVGTIEVRPENILTSGCLGPGQMLEVCLLYTSCLDSLKVGESRVP